MNFRVYCFPILAISALVVPFFAPAAPLPAVPAPREPVTNTYHGVTITDEYQWLENAGDPKVREWTAKENERTRAYFSELPYRNAIAKRLMKLRIEESARYFGLQQRKDHWFALRFKPPAQQPVLIQLGSLTEPGQARVVFDPNKYDTNGATAMDWYVPSNDGKKVAISMSQHGSEQGTLYFFDVETGKKIGEEIPRVQYPTGGGSAAWNENDTGVFYTRYPHKGERAEVDTDFYQQVWFHLLGSPVATDKYEIGKAFPRIAEIALESSDDGYWTLATVANGDGGDFAHYLRAGTGRWVQLTKFADGVKHGRFGHDNALYFRSLKDAPRGKVLRFLPDVADFSQAEVVASERRGVVQEFAAVEGGLFVSYLLGGPSELLYFSAGSDRPRGVPILPISTVTGLDSWRGNELVYGNVSYLDPFSWFTFRPGDRPRRTALQMTSPVDFSDMEVVREFATSRDGTQVPVNILRKKGLELNGKNPTLLYGYGGYGINLTPSFDSSRRIWFDAGGVLAIANLRGGGEYGESWHKAGNLTRKQNVFDDFIAAAEHLISRGYTSSSKLAVEGGSNGGLLMGAFLTQRPELARAVVSHVGIYDMLRVELDPNGQFNITEFGTVKDPEQFKALYAYSPYHHVQKGVKYPAVLLTTGENDGRVNPAQSRKMAAILQADTGSPAPILFRSTASAGHGIGTALKERIAEHADVLSFLFDQLGMEPGKSSDLLP